jgi:G3E family GTPase
LAAALSGIPVNLVTGRDAGLKSRIVAGLLERRPSGARWAVLVNETGTEHAAHRPAGEGIYFRDVAQGCICCTAQLPMRVGLTRLLRETGPDRLFIQPVGGARTGEIRRMLADRWLAPVLSLRATIHVVAAADFSGRAPDEMQAAQLAAAQVVVVDTEHADRIAIDAAARYLSALSNAPQIVWLPGRVDAAMLDLEGAPPQEVRLESAAPPD